MEDVRNEEEWVRLLAQQLVSDVTEWMSGIILIAESPPRQERDRTMDAIYGCVEGELNLQMRLDAEPEMVHRLAARIIGQEPESEEETQEYATEYFNVLCGRFISELCRGKRPKMRFFTPLYEEYPEITPLDGENAQTISFRSDEEERVLFSWVIQPQSDPGT